MELPRRTLGTLALVAASASILTVSACGGSTSSSSSPSATTAVTVGSAVASMGGKTTVEVDGKTLEGFDNTGCVREGDMLNIGSGSASGSGLGGRIKDGNPPTVQQLGIATRGVQLSVVTTPVAMGSATVSKDGNVYTITGTGETLGGSKSFKVEVTCN